MADPTDEVIAKLEARLGRPVEPRLCDEATLDESAATARTQTATRKTSRGRSARTAPELSAYRTSAIARADLDRVHARLPARRRACSSIFGSPRRCSSRWPRRSSCLSTGFRLYAAWQGSRPGATIDPPARRELAALDERELPLYTMLLPLYKEKPATVRALFDALSRMDYPKHKLDALLLIEADDDHTRAAIEQGRVGRRGCGCCGCRRARPRTKPRAMGIGLRYAKGTLVTVYDAEDKPDPTQLKKAVWGFQRADASVACLQAKLGYYNPRQNLLTRWFTLEYDALVQHLPARPAPHRRADPAGGHVEPLPPRGARGVPRLGPLQRHRGRRPRVALRPARADHDDARVDHRRGGQQPGAQLAAPALALEQGLHADRARPHAPPVDGCCASSGRRPRPFSCSRSAAPSSPRCWPRCSGCCSLLWAFFQPEWIAALFPGPIYYAASVSLVAGNFALVFLSLGAAVSRGHDDLAPYALLMPCYWALMSAATYMALVELFVRPVSLAQDRARPARGGGADMSVVGGASAPRWRRPASGDASAPAVRAPAASDGVVVIFVLVFAVEFAFGAVDGRAEASAGTTRCLGRPARCSSCTAPIRSSRTSDSSGLRCPRCSACSGRCSIRSGRASSRAASRPR